MKLNMEQRRIVELEPSGPMMVKGVAGSGKTTVAIRRIHYLMDHHCHDENDRILLVTYNKTLLNYIKFQYERMVDKEEPLRLFAPNAEVKISTIDSLMFGKYSEYLRRTNQKFTIANTFQMMNCLKRAIGEVKKQYPDIKLLSESNSKFLLAEADWISSCGLTELADYQSADRIGRASGTSGTPQKLLKNSTTREAIFEVARMYGKFLEKERLMSFKRMNELALSEVRRSNDWKYTHIIIDESQDLTRVQLEFLKELYEAKDYSSLMFVADNTQSIYPESWLGKGRPYTTIGYDMSGKSRTLSKNYRTTTEISQAAFDLIAADETIQENIDFVKPALIDRHGHQPIYHYSKVVKEQADFLAHEITQLRADYRLSEICVVARSKRSVESAAADLEKLDIPCEILQGKEPDFESDKVKLVTMHSIKGLEFKVIFLIDLNDGVIPQKLYADAEDQKTWESDERKLLYVGMTRASELLYLSSVGTASKFIAEIDRKHLRMRKDALIRPFESISMTHYQLRNQIVDEHAKEEVTRQWLIRELNETYGYPLELLQLEYPVQQFSRKGYCDIAVKIHANGEERPYIIAELKSFGTGIDDAINQLASYLQADGKALYGIATDGVSFKVINQEGEELPDLPKCQTRFLPEERQRSIYRNLKNGQNYEYIQEQGSENDIEVRKAGEDVLLQVDELIEVPLIGNVAAGIPELASENYETTYLLPREWLMAPKKSFSLTVTGNSMNGAGIDKGDVVIVHQQETAANGDIIIAVIDGEATMKKYMPMGSDILLVAENPEFEPIMMRSDDVYINGRVIGVLKS